MLFIHGTSDTTIDCNHTMELHKRCPPQFQRDPYIIRGAGHDNVIEYDPERYFSTVGAFMQSLAGEATARAAGEVAMEPVTPSANPTTPGGGPAATHPFLVAGGQTPAAPTPVPHVACPSESLTASWTR